LLQATHRFHYSVVRVWNRAGGVGGILFVVSLLLVVAVGPLTNPTPEPAFNAPSSAFLAFARSADSRLDLLELIGIAGMFGFVLFAAVLCARFQAAERAWTAPVILVVLATAVLSTLWLAEFGIRFAGDFRRASLDATSASLLFGLANGIFVVSWAAIAGFLAAAGIAALHYRSMPRWLAWSAPVIGTALLLTVAVPLTFLWFVPYFLFYMWVLAVSVLLLRS